MWTGFMDMHSGGGSKERWGYIYIEAPEAEARVIFYNRFGHSPDRVTCTCCGSDYSVSEGTDLAQATGYERCCMSAGPADSTGEPRYMEPGEALPEGWVMSSFQPSGRYRPLDEYLSGEDVLVIRADEIAAGERQGMVPEQGYVWID